MGRFFMGGRPDFAMRTMLLLHRRKDAYYCADTESAGPIDLTGFL